MSWIDKLSLQGVRCFASPKPAEFGKVTLLVGKNNSGKSAFLGCLHALAGLAGFCDLMDPPLGEPGRFNDSPYGLGDFSTIARDGSDQFVVDGTLGAYGHTRLRITFAESHGHPSERELEVVFQDRHDNPRSLRVRRECGPPEIWHLNGDDFSFAIRRADVSYREISTWLSQAIRRGYLPFEGNSSTYRKRFSAGFSAENQVMFGRMTNCLRTMPFPSRPIAAVSSPVVPPPRARQCAEHPLGTKDLAETAERLAELGNRLELFTDVEVKRDLHTQFFELRFKESGVWRNTVDVGYGIHAVLPLLRILVDKAEGTTFLLQKPEVHLHAFVQATLAQMMAESPHRFVIETHSDHFIDRFRICVMKGMLRPEDLRIIYFERSPKTGETQIHNIWVDRQGNIWGDPDSYRVFFMEEARRLLGLD